MGSDVGIEVDRLPVLLPRSSQVGGSGGVGSSVGGGDNPRVVEDADGEEEGEGRWVRGRKGNGKERKNEDSQNLTRIDSRPSWGGDGSLGDGYDVRVPNVSGGVLTEDEV